MIHIMRKVTNVGHTRDTRTKSNKLAIAIMLRISKTYASMSCSHMIINTLRLGEGLQTHPANVCQAASAGHVIAPCNLLNRRPAARTAFDIMRFQPLLEKLLSIYVTVRTRHAIMSFSVAAGTDTCQTRRTLQDRVGWRRSIDLRTVGGRTIVKFVWAGVHIRKKKRH